MDTLQAATVAVSLGHDAYGREPPYSPVIADPEYPFAPETLSETVNPAYEGVRNAFRLLDLDAGRHGEKSWNPLGVLVRPGDTVVLKPNFVREFRETRPDHANCLITHGAVIRAVLDYAFLALEGRGRLIIADAPHNDADFDSIRRIVGLDEIVAFYRDHAGFDVEVYDLRPERARKIRGVIVDHEPLSGDPAGYTKVNLASASAFSEIGHLCHLLYGSEYDLGELQKHHHDDVHEYMISRTILDADVVISLPKLKTHKKVALTVNMKNLVGINGNKNWLPHHREGTPCQGGDQFADDRLKRRIERSLVARFKRWFPVLGPLRGLIAGPIKSLGERVFGRTEKGTIRSGNWFGNDTTWRMVLDLNRILLYADATGRLHERPIRRFLSLVDGIVAGEGNGPLDPTPRPTGAIIAGFNPVSVDLTCARLMGFDHTRIPMLLRSFDKHPMPLAAFGPEDVTVRSNGELMDGPLGQVGSGDGGFAPHFGWRGHIELAGGGNKKGAGPGAAEPAGAKSVTKQKPGSQSGARLGDS